MLSATALLESFEGETFPPILWDMKQGLWERNTTTKHHGKTSIVNTESTVDTIITPLLLLSAGDSIAFSVRATSSSGYNTDILYSADGKTWNLLKSFAIYANYWSDWAEMAAYMPEDFTEGDYYIGRTEFDSPEVDPEVLIECGDKVLEIGNFYRVEIINSDDFDLFGRVL